MTALKYEYKFLWDLDEDMIAETLNEMDAEGWAPVMMTNMSKPYYKSFSILLRRSKI